MRAYGSTSRQNESNAYPPEVEGIGKDDGRHQRTLHIPPPKPHTVSANLTFLNFAGRGLCGQRVSRPGPNINGLGRA